MSKQGAPIEMSLLDGEPNKPIIHLGSGDGHGRDSAMENGSCSPARLWMVTALVFIAISIGLAVFVIHTEARQKDTPESQVIRLFPGFFRTPLEQAYFAAKIDQTYELQNVTVVEKTRNGTQDQRTCVFSCSPRDGFPDFLEGTARKKRHTGQGSSLLSLVADYKAIHHREKRSANLIYHGCCISQRRFEDYGTLLNYNNLNRTIVQFEGHRQYFLIQICRHAADCFGCTCAQETSLVTAVVENPDPGSDEEYVLELVRVPGCCKCFNNLNQSS